MEVRGIGRQSAAGRRTAKDSSFYIHPWPRVTTCSVLSRVPCSIHCKYLNYWLQEICNMIEVKKTVPFYYDGSQENWQAVCRSAENIHPWPRVTTCSVLSKVPSSFHPIKNCKCKVWTPRGLACIRNLCRSSANEMVIFEDFILQYSLPIFSGMVCKLVKNRIKTVNLKIC